MIRFLIESSVCLGLFYGVYWLFLRKEKFLSVNRFFLLGAVIISMIVPLLEFSFQPQWASTVQVLQIPPLVDSVEMAEARAEAKPIDWFSLIYFAGLSISVLLLIMKVWITKRRLGLSFRNLKRGIQVINVEGYHAFSFWNTIVLGKKIENDSELKDQVLSHEMAHVKGKHSLDLLLMELLKCVYWFNPFIYFSAASLKIQHEYIADQHVLKIFSPTTYERSLATITLAKIDQSLVHGFGNLPIDRRIKMIYTTNSNIMNKFKLLFALPILALLVFQFSCADDPFQASDELPDQGMTAKLERSIHAYNVSGTDGHEVKKEAVSLEGVVTDLNGNVLSNVTVKTSVSGKEATSDADGKFRIMVTDRDEELILSHPSKRQSKVTLGEHSGMEVVEMVEVPDELLFEESKAALKLHAQYKLRMEEALREAKSKAEASGNFELIEEIANGKDVPVPVSSIKLRNKATFEFKGDKEVPLTAEQKKEQERKMRLVEGSLSKMKKRN